MVIWTETDKLIRTLTYKSNQIATKDLHNKKLKNIKMSKAHFYFAQTCHY